MLFLSVRPKSPPPTHIPSLLSSPSHMATAVCFSCVKSVVGSAAKPSTPLPSKSSISFQDPVFLLQSPLISTVATSSRLQSLKAKAADSNKVTKTSSIVCSDCEGNGAILCSQCKGTGVNSIDHFNGQFKAGGLCWLCRGKRDILCGSCNGAGFLGGFMSTFEE